MALAPKDPFLLPLSIWGKLQKQAIGTPRLETFIACTEADFENRPCVRKNCAKLVREEFPTGPRKFVRKMCGGIRKCAEIARNLCGCAAAQFARNIGGGASENVRAQVSRIFAPKLEFFPETKLYGQKMSQPKTNVVIS